MEANYFTLLYWFCHTSALICHGYTHVPHPEPPFPSLPVPSLWVISVHQPQASCILHWTWIGDSFLIWYYTCFSAILPNHPTLSLSHRVHCSIHLCLFCCLAYRVIVTIFLNSIYICINIQYWCFSFWLTSLCIIGSSFIYLIRSDSNAFFLMAEKYSIVNMYHSFLIHSPADGMSLLFNMLSRLVITFLPRRKCLFISWLRIWYVSQNWRETTE